MKKLKEKTSKRLALFARLTLMFIALLAVTAIIENHSQVSVFGMSLCGLMLVGMKRSPESEGGTETEAEKKLLDKIKSQVKSLIDGSEKTSTEKLVKLEGELKTLGESIKGLSDYATLKEEHIKLMEDIKALKETPGAPSKNDLSIVAALKSAIQKNVEKFAKMKKGDLKTFSIDIAFKASQVPGDIGTRTDYADFLPGTTFKPVRKPFLRELFRRVPVGGEYIKYREEDTVTRDAKVVVACATSTHNTKKTWVTRTVQIQKVRDMVDICIDMIDDYDFVESEIRQLVEQSVKLKADAEIFSGSGAIMSIDSIASDFDAANVLAPFTGAFKSPTIAELTAAMKAQIYTFGQENAWDADTIIMNHNDRVKFMHEKNADGDYLLPNFVLTNGGMLNGMQIITNPLVAANTLYVLDSRKGQVLDRQMLTVEFSYENGTNFESELVTVKAIERLQFHVKQIEQDAFMKCTDIEAALTAITKL